jgi:hypothetical protein
MFTAFNNDWLQPAAIKQQVDRNLYPDVDPAA